MEKIIELLGLDPKASDTDVLKAIEKLKADGLSALKKLEEATAPKLLPNREKLIREKMSAGLSREVAEEAVRQQEVEDERVEKEEKARAKAKK